MPTPLYIRFRKGKVHRTIEILDDMVYMDFDKLGRALGIEVLEGVVEKPRKGQLFPKRK